MRLKRVNIITPTYNDAHRFLIDTILSVQRQVNNQNQFQIIHTIIDDGSTDKKSIEFLNRLEKVKSLNLIQQSNKGLAAARNNGINSIDSDYIIPLDSDDLISPCYVDILISNLKLTNTDNSLAYTNWASFGRYKRFIEVKKATPYNIRLANYLPVSLMLPTPLAIDNPYDEKMLLGCEDWDLWIRLLCKGCKTSHAKILGFFHREHQKNMTSDTLSKFSKIKNYLKEKHHNLYTKEYNNKQKKLFPPSLYDIFRTRTNPNYRYLLISKFKNIL